MRSRLLRQANWGVVLAILAGFLLMVNYLSARHFRRWDLTTSRSFTVSDQARKVLSSLKAPLKVTVFLSPADELFGRVTDLLDAFREVSPRISVETIDPDRDRARVQALAQEYKVNVANVVVFEAEGRTRHVEKDQMVEYDFAGLQGGAPARIKAFKAEEAFVNAILDVLDPHKPVIYFTSGHGERGVGGRGEGVGILRDRLEKEGAQVRDWVGLGKSSVPEDADALVVAGPQGAFLPEEAQALEAYFQRGGRALLLLDPVLEGRPPTFAATGLEGTLNRWGVVLKDDVVLDPAAAVPQMGPQTFFAARFGDHVAVQDLARNRFLVLFGLARSLETGPVEEAGYAAAVLVSSSPSSWGLMRLTDLEEGVAKGPGDPPGPLALAAAVASADPSKKTRLVVTGDSDVATDGLLAAGFGNQLFCLNALHWLLEQESRIAIPPKASAETHLDLTASQANVLLLLFVVVLPASVAAAGGWVYLQRRR
jgi:ABC-type uncharacterized transport system involved in gliding motility auxiliary subunit